MKEHSSHTPMISSADAGILGLLHLPRLWLKASLANRKRLRKGYPACGKGFDAKVLGVLGLAWSVVQAYVKKARPNLVEFQLWVAEQPTAKTFLENKAAVEEVNQWIRNYKHDDATRHYIFGLYGLTDATCTVRDAITLNNMEDAFYYHSAVLKGDRKKTKAATSTANTSDETTAEATATTNTSTDSPKDDPQTTDGQTTADPEAAHAEDESRGPGAFNEAPPVHAQVTEPEPAHKEAERAELAGAATS